MVVKGGKGMNVYRDMAYNWRQFAPGMDSQTLRYNLAREAMNLEFADRQERAALVEEITNRVLSKINVEVLNKSQGTIQEIKKQIDDIMNI